MFSGLYLESTGTGEYINSTGLHDFKIVYNDLSDVFKTTENDGNISKITYTGEKDVMVLGITKAKFVRYTSSDTWRVVGTYKVNSEGSHAIGVTTASFQKDWGYAYGIPYTVRLTKGESILLVASDDFVKTESGSYAWLTIIKTFE